MNRKMTQRSNIRFIYRYWRTSVNTRCMYPLRTGDQSKRGRERGFQVLVCTGILLRYTNLSYFILICFTYITGKLFVPMCVRMRNKDIQYTRFIEVPIRLPLFLLFFRLELDFGIVLTMWYFLFFIIL